MAQKGRHNIGSCFIDKAVALTTGGFVSGAHGLPLKLISCTLISLSMLVDASQKSKKMAPSKLTHHKYFPYSCFFCILVSVLF